MFGWLGCDYLKCCGFNIIDEVVGLFDYLLFIDIKDFVFWVIVMFVDGVYDELYIYYNYYVSKIL